MNLLEQYQALNQKDYPTVAINHNAEKDLYTVKYIHASVDFSNPLYSMARGLTIDSQGNIVIRGFEKFFNWKQLEKYTMYSREWIKQKSHLADVESEDLVVTAYEKLDGSLILLSQYQNELIASTTSSSNNLYTERALNFFNNHEKVNDILAYVTENNMTLLFEFISPRNQIVIFHDKEDYVLIGAVDNKTGARQSYDELVAIANTLNLSVVKATKMTLKELIAMQETAQDTEGVVVENQWGNLLKFKTDAWFENKDVSDFFFGFKLTKRKIKTVYEAYVNDELDDLIAMANQRNVVGDLDFITPVVDALETLRNRVDSVYNATRHLEIKDIAAMNLFPIIQSMVIDRRVGRKTKEATELNWLINELLR